MAVSFNTLSYLRGVLTICGTLVAISSAEAAPGRSWFALAFTKLIVNVGLDKDCTGKSVEAVYTSCLSKDGNTITLRGRIPSSNDLKFLQGTLTAVSPSTTLDDKSTNDEKVPDRDTWLAGMTFAIQHLMRLEKGNVTLQGNSISMDGITRADDNFGDIQEKIRDQVPKGFTLKEAGLRPASVRPFVWLAEVNHGDINLSGHVPDEQKTALLAYAATLFPPDKVNNAMASAQGAPDGWGGAARLALEMLSRMQQGRVMLSDRVIILGGVFSSPGMDELVKAYSDKLPKGFRLEAKFTP